MIIHSLPRDPEVETFHLKQPRFVAMTDCLRLGHGVRSGFKFELHPTKEAVLQPCFNEYALHHPWLDQNEASGGVRHPPPSDPFAAHVRIRRDHTLSLVPAQVTHDTGRQRDSDAWLIVH